MAMNFPRQFFQYLHQLESQGIAIETVNMQPAASLSFTTKQIKKLQQLGDDYQLILTFMGLYGVQSPLPDYFLQQALFARGACLRAFLNLFNQRFYELLYQAWKKSHPIHAQHPYLHYLQALLGAKELKPHQLILSNLSRRPRWSLSTMLSFMPWKIRMQQVPQWQPISLPTKLGQQQHALGDNVLLGRHLLTNVLQIKLMQTVPHHHREIQQLLARLYHYVGCESLQLCIENGVMNV